MLAVCVAAIPLAESHTAAAQARSITFRVNVAATTPPSVRSVRVQFASSVAPPPPAISLTRSGDTFEGTCPVGPGVKAVITPTLVIETDDVVNPVSRFPAMACDFTDPKNPSRMRYRIDRDYSFTLLDVTAVAQVVDGGTLRNVAAPCMARLFGFNRARRQWVEVAQITRRDFTALARLALAQVCIPVDRRGLDFSERMEVRATYVTGTNTPNMFLRREWRLPAGLATQTLNLVFSDPIAPVRIAFRDHLPNLGIDAAHARDVADVPVDYEGTTGGPRWSHLLGYLPEITMPIVFTLGNDQEGDNLMHEWGHHFLFTMDWQPSNTRYLVLDRSDTDHTPGEVADGEHIAWEEALCHVIGTWGFSRYLTARSPTLRLPHSGATEWRDNAQDAKHAIAIDGYNGRVLRDKRRGRSNTGGWIEDVVTASLFAYYAERGVTDPETFLRTLFADLRAYCAAVTNQQAWCADGFFCHVRGGLTGPAPGVDERRIVDQIVLWYRISIRADVARHGPIDTLVPVVAVQAGAPAPVQPGEPVEILAFARAFPRLFETSKFHRIVARLIEGGQTLGEASFRKDTSRPGLNAVAQFKHVFQKPGSHPVRVEVWGDFVGGTLERIGRSAELTLNVVKNQATIQLEPALFRPDERVKARIKLVSPGSGAGGTWHWTATGPVTLESNTGDSVRLKVKNKGSLTARLMASPGRGQPAVERARADLVVEPMEEKTYTIPLKAVGKNWFLQAHIGHGAFNLKNFMSRVFLTPGEASGQILWKPTPRSKKQFAESWYTYIPIEVEIKGNIKIQATGVFIDQFGDPASIIYLDPSYPNWVQNTRVAQAPDRAGPATWDRKTNSGGAMLARFRFVGRSREMKKQKDLEYGAFPRCMIYYRYDIEMWNVKNGQPTKRCGQDWTCHNFMFQVLRGPPPGPALTVGPAAVPKTPAAPPATPPKPARVFKLTLNDPGKTVVELGERLPLCAVFTLNGKAVTATNFVFHWQPHPEADFEEFESTKPSTAVCFKETGPVKVWVSALERTGEVLRTVAEAQHIELTVLPRSGRAAPLPPAGAQPAPARPPSRPAAPQPAPTVPTGTGATGTTPTLPGGVLPSPPKGAAPTSPAGTPPATVGGAAPASPTGSTAAGPGASGASGKASGSPTASSSVVGPSFTGTLGSSWQPVNAAGGNFGRHARAGSQGLEVRIPRGSSWGKTGIRSRDPIFTVDPKKPVTHRIDLELDPAGTRSFCMALTDHPAADAWHSTNVWYVWMLPPFARRARVDFLSSPTQADRTTDFLPPRCPSRVSMLVRGDEVEVRTSLGTVHRRRFPWLGRAGARAWLQVFSHAPSPNIETCTHLRSIQISETPEVPAAIPPLPRETPPPAAEPLPVFTGQVDAAWVPIEAAGGRYKDHARPGSSGLRVNVPENQSWGKVGVRSATPIVFGHPTLDQEPLRIDLTFDPGETTGFCVALSPSVLADVCHAETVWLNWARTAHGLDGILDLRNTRQPGDTVQRVLTAPVAPEQLTLVVKHGRVEVITPAGRVAAGDYAWLKRPGVPVYLYVFSHPCQANAPVKMQLRRIALRGGAAAVPEVSKAPPASIPRVTVFSGKVEAPWAPLAAAGGDFGRFARPGRSGLVVQCPGKASWAKTGIRSTRPLFAVNPFLAERPVELSFTFDTERTSCFCIALCSSSSPPGGDPWHAENVHVNWSADPDRRGSVLHVIQSRKPGECDRRVRLEGHTPREVVLRVSDGRLEVRFDGKRVAEARVSWLGREGTGVFPCVFASPRAEHGACAMTLRRVVASRAPAGR